MHFKVKLRIYLAYTVICETEEWFSDYVTLCYDTVRKYGHRFHIISIVLSNTTYTSGSCHWLLTGTCDTAGAPCRHRIMVTRPHGRPVHWSSVAALLGHSSNVTVDGKRVLLRNNDPTFWEFCPCGATIKPGV